MKEKQITDLIVRQDPQLQAIRSEILSGNTQLLTTYLGALGKLLENPIDHDKVYTQVNELCMSAQPGIIIQLNNQIFPQIARKHTRRDLDKYILYWRQTFHGSGIRLNYPNVAKTLNSVPIENEKQDIFSEFSQSGREFQKNIALLQQKRVQFFEDMEGDSFLSDSVDGNTLLDIIEMDIQEIKEIRKVVESGPIDEIQAEQYFKKMKNFLGIRPKTLSKQLSQNFNKQKIWAKEYIECYKEYCSSGGNVNLYKHLGNGKKMIATSREPEKNKFEEFSDGNISFNSKQEEVVNLEDPLKNHFNQARRIYADGDKKAKSQVKNEYKGPPQTANFLPGVSGADNISSNREIMPLETEQVNLSEVDKSPKSYKAARFQNVYSKDLKINDEKYPISQSQYQDVQKKKDEFLGRKTADPHFILDTSQIRNASPINRYTHEANLSESRNSRRSKIFSKKDPIQKKILEEQPEEQDLVVVKHRATADPRINVHTENSNPYSNPMMRNTLASQYQNTSKSPNPPYFTSQQFTPVNHKTERNALSPNTAFPSRTLYGTTSSKKLSQFTQQKRQRRMVAPVEELSPIEDYVLKPYSQNFNDLGNFARFRRNCLEDNFTLYASSFLLVSCVVLRQSDSRVKIQILYENQSHSNLAVESVYRVPKCFKIQKYSKINKRFILHDQVQHVFALQLVSFPLEACILNLKYTLEMNGDQIRYQTPTPIVIPLTMRNFLEYLILGEQEWRRYWAKWSQNRNFSLTRHILLDRLVASDDTIESALKQFTQIPGIEGYSIQEFGAFCRHNSYDRLKFLLRISLRVDNILSLEILTDRKVNDQDETDFLQYCLNVWSMLLSKIMDSSVV